MEGLVDQWASCFKGRRVLVTGHTGFKGSWLSIWLHQLGAKVGGFSLAPNTTPSNFELSAVERLLDYHHIGDIRDGAALQATFDNFKPEFVFHLAAQPIVKLGYDDPVGTFATNAIGTANVLEAIRQSGRPCVVVVVSSDKCYHNEEHVWGYREGDALGGHDPYSASKAATEIVANSYRSSYFAAGQTSASGVRLATARAGNVLGGGDWAPQRIMTDIIASLASGHAVALRNPGAVRPWQHVLEPLSGYLQLAARMSSDSTGAFCSAWNFGPSNASTVSVQKITELALDVWGQGQWQDVSSGHKMHEAQILRLAIDKANTELNWWPRWDLATSIERTVEWYKTYHQKKPNDMQQVCRDDIDAYTLMLS